MNSARPRYHRRYYRPRGFGLDEVRASIRVMKAAGRHVSLNYFILPGFTDDPAEYQALADLVRSDRPDLIQLRNLNMDPEAYRDGIGFTASGPALGILDWWTRLKQEFPALRFGYFNPCLNPGP